LPPAKRMKGSDQWEVYFGWDLPHPAANGGFIK
jgi:hypothetical protein